MVVNLRCFALPSGVTAVRSLKLDEGEDSEGRPTLSCVCGNRFLVQNSLEDSVSVRWTVDRSSDSGSVWLPPKPASAAHSERFFTTRGADTTRLYLKKKLVRAVANGGTVCPGSLTIIAGTGVVGLHSGTTAYANGATVTYAAQPDVGYAGVHVFLDTVELGASGTITIAGPRTLFAYATIDSTTLPAPDPGLVARYRALLTSRHAVADYQSLLCATSALAHQVGADHADPIVTASAAAAFQLPADTAALLRLERALDRHLFAAESLPPNLPALRFNKRRTLPFGFPAPAGDDAAERRRALKSPSRGLRASTMRAVTTVVGGGGGGGGGSPINPRPVHIVHVNGWFTDVGSWQQNVVSLEQAVREVPQFADTALVHVSGVYNFSGLSSARIVTRGARCSALFFPDLLGHLPWWLLRQFTQPCDAAALRSLLHDGGGEIFETLTQVAQILTNTPPHLNSVTLDSLLDRELGAGRDGNHVIVVPHSQGNLFMISSLTALAALARAPSDTDAACVAMIPTASPTSRGYPASAYRVQPVQLEGDFINNLASPPIFFPQFTPVETPLFDNLLANSRSGLGWADQLHLHNFRQSYLAPLGGRPLIKQGLATIYANCEMRVTVNAPDTVLASGLMMLYATVTDANGNSIDPGSSLVWRTSDSLVASIDQQGVLTAVAPGRVRVTATYRHRFADAFVTVGGPGPHLTVEVQNTASNVAPFWLAPSSGQVWRRREVIVTVTSTDSLTSVNAVDVQATERYGRVFGLTPTQSRLPGGQFHAEALFFDNPRTLNGRQLRFNPGSRLFVMDDAVYVSIDYSQPGKRAIQLLRIPLSP